VQGRRQPYACALRALLWPGRAQKDSGGLRDDVRGTGDPHLWHDDPGIAGLVGVVGAVGSNPRGHGEHWGLLEATV
jgi:hypothetical protein